MKASELAESRRRARARAAEATMAEVRRFKYGKGVTHEEADRPGQPDIGWPRSVRDCR